MKIRKLKYRNIPGLGFVFIIPFIYFFFLLLNKTNRFHYIIENDFLSACTLKRRKTKLGLTFSSSLFSFFLSFRVDITGGSEANATKHFSAT